MKGKSGVHYLKRKPEVFLFKDLNQKRD